MDKNKNKDVKKRYYNVGELVWVIDRKEEGKIESIDRKNLSVTVKLINSETVNLKFWEIDKLKYKAKERFKVRKKEWYDRIYTNRLNAYMSIDPPTIYFAKVRKDAIIPTKRKEDAGYDIYADLSNKGMINGAYEIYCPAFKTTLVPTGIAMALPKTHYFNLKHERGSTGKLSMSVLAGVVDSGYRGEIFVAITPLYKDILITSEVEETEELSDVIMYPYSKAICQGTIDLVPQVNIEEISFEDLQNIESERGDSKLGQSGK